MIIEAILALLFGLFEALLSFMALALPIAPGWWAEIGSAIDVVLGGVGEPIRHFLPLGPLVAAGVILMTLRLTLGGLKLARRALSLFTGGGGMA